MAVTTRTQMVVPEILADAVAGAWPNRVALAGTPAVVESATLPGDAQGGSSIRVPFFGTIGEFTDVAEGIAAPLGQLTTTSEVASVVRTARAVEITTWAQLAAQYADPYAEAANQIIAGARRRFDAALVAAANAAAVGGGPGPGTLVHDTSAAITYAALVDALGRFEDESDQVAAVVVHPKTRDDLRKLTDTTGRPLFVEPTGGGLPQVLGLPLIVSNRVEVLTGPPIRYRTLLVKRGALALWYNGVPRIETDRNILTDTDILAVNVYYVAHRYGRLPGSRLPGVLQLVTL